jgi:hypothetical protein
MAARDSESEFLAWKAWACHDPEAALAAASAERPAYLESVARGIGEFHPDWFKANLDRMPEEVRAAGFGGYANWVEGGEPVAMLTFLTEHGEWTPGELIDRMIREDPWAALDWFKAKEEGVTRFFEDRDGGFDTLIRNLGTHHPEILAELAAREPAGARRRAMEEILFNRLVESDLDAAMAQARATTASRIAAERLAAVGVALARTDPERGFEIARDLITNHPNALNGSTSVRYPSGWSSWGDGDGKAEELVDVLVAADPARMMAIADGGREEDGGGWRNEVAEQWARQDVEGFAQWVTEQNGEVRRTNSVVVLEQLLNQETYEEAMGWAMSVDRDRTTFLTDTLARWALVSPQEARAWLDSSPLPDAERAEFQSLFSEPE